MSGRAYNVTCLLFGHRLHVPQHPHEWDPITCGRCGETWEHTGSPRRWASAPTPTLPPSSRQRGRNPAKAAHDRRISSADEADLRDDGGTP